MSQSVPSSPFLPSQYFSNIIDLESLITAILKSSCRSIIITFSVTLPVPTIYDVAITGDLEVMGKWNISNPLYLKRKSPLEYIGKIKLLVSEQLYDETATSTSTNTTNTTNITSNSDKLESRLTGGNKDSIATLLINRDLLSQLFNTDFIVKYKYVTLLDGAPMSWETANRTLCLKWWIGENCQSSDTNFINELSNGISNRLNGTCSEPKEKLMFGNRNKFIIDKNNASQLVLNQDDGLFGSSSIRKFGKNVPSLYKPVDAEWIYNHVQLRIYQPTDSHPRLNEEDVLIHVLGKKTRLSIVDTDTYVITAPSLDQISFHVNIIDPENSDNIKSIAFITHELLQQKDVGEICCPFIDTKTFKIIGHFKALFLLVKPFNHADNNLRRVSRTLNWQQQSQMKSPDQKSFTKFIGHRGLGKSTSVTKNRAFIEENSMLSFQRSAAVGVDYIEFDVQLTKDLQPVIFHDFVAKIRVDEKNTITIPVQDLTLKELIKLGMKLKPHFDDANVKRLTKLMEQRKHKLKRSNSYDQLSTSIETDEKKKRTTWSISEAFATLKECFEKVPYHVGFNIEIKWPIEINIFNPNIPRNTFIDHILKCVFDFAGPRHIMFSSFDPDICTLLNLKQPKYPVFFLTEAGQATFADHRCNSIPAAISFAKAIGLRGIVADCTPIIRNPSWIQMVHDHDLMIATFGEANTLPENIKIQQDMGIDAIICDNIDRIFKNRKKLQSEGIEIDTKQLLSGEPTRLSQWIEEVQEISSDS